MRYDEALSRPVLSRGVIIVVPGVGLVLGYLMI